MATQFLSCTLWPAYWLLLREQHNVQETQVETAMVGCGCMVKQKWSWNWQKRITWSSKFYTTCGKPHSLDLILTANTGHICIAQLMLSKWVPFKAQAQALDSSEVNSKRRKLAATGMNQCPMEVQGSTHTAVFLNEQRCPENLKRSTFSIFEPIFLHSFFG